MCIQFDCVSFVIYHPFGMVGNVMALLILLRSRVSHTFQIETNRYILPIHCAVLLMVLMMMMIMMSKMLVHTCACACAFPKRIFDSLLITNVWIAFQARPFFFLSSLLSMQFNILFVHPFILAQQLQFCLFRVTMLIHDTNTDCMVRFSSSSSSFLVNIVCCLHVDIAWWACAHAIRSAHIEYHLVCHWAAKWMEVNHRQTNE